MDLNKPVDFGANESLPLEKAVEMLRKQFSQRIVFSVVTCLRERGQASLYELAVLCKENITTVKRVLSVLRRSLLVEQESIGIEIYYKNTSVQIKFIAALYESTKDESTKDYLRYVFSLDQLKDIQQSFKGYNQLVMLYNCFYSKYEKTNSKKQKSFTKSFLYKFLRMFSNEDACINRNKYVATIGDDTTIFDVLKNNLIMGAKGQYIYCLGPEGKRMFKMLPPLKS